MKKLLKNIKKFILDIFFPSFCVGCKKEGAFLCKKCKEKIYINKYPCSLPKKSKIKKIYCATDYHQKNIEKLIHSFKYKFIKDTKNELSEIIIKHLELSEFKKTKNQILIPVPLHKKRLKWRGFNQSEILASEIGKKLNIPVSANVIFKIKNTETQTQQKSKKDRIKNIKGAFIIKNENIIKDKDVILVDDVFTTGATLKECSKQIQKAKPKSIEAIVVAK